MKKMLKKLSCLFLSLVMALGVSTSLVGCSRLPDTDNFLEIYCLDVGYGVEWLENLLEMFAKEDWVKEKYPEFGYDLSKNGIQSYATTKLSGNSTVDLIFTTANLSEYIGNESRYDLAYNLTDTLYNRTVPGEERTYKEKMNESYVSAFKYIGRSDNTDENFYIAPWTSGVNGLFYNKDLLCDQLGYQVPVTTNELFKIMDDVKLLKGNKEGKYNKGYSIIRSGDSDYIHYVFDSWWAQYDSYEGYVNFYSGKVGNRITRDIFKQEGRLKSLEVIEKIVSYDNDYEWKEGLTLQFMPAQTAFLQGEALFHFNGDWFDREMSAIKASIQEQYDIRMMKLPIISSIVEKLENTQMTDAELAATIRAIDSGAESYEGVSAKDFAYLRAARNVASSLGMDHVALVPSYATAKDLATDLLLFMASDKYQSTYIRSTKGTLLPFDYDITEKNPELFATFSDSQKERLNWFTDEKNALRILPAPKSFPLVKIGGLNALSSAGYVNEFSKQNKTLTSQMIFDRTIEAWDEQTWQSALSSSGVF